MRQVILDTETTGMNKFGAPYEGHRVIEIGAVEIIDRRLTGEKFHVYLRPDRVIELEAFRVHGISDKFLENQPDFSDIVEKFLSFIKNSELIMHNAAFDLGFLNNELKMFDVRCERIESYCKIIDTLKLARKIFPGQRNNLDALCERYSINRDKRGLHNALIDAQLLAYVFLSMTGGQTRIKFTDNIKPKISYKVVNNKMKESHTTEISCLNSMMALKVIQADEEEKISHEECLDFMQKINNCCLWRQFYK